MAKIVVVDDNDQFRRMLQETLEKAGYDVRSVSSGPRLMDTLQESSADLIVTDIIMPDQDGIETIGQIRRSFPAAKIVAISGGGRFGSAAYLETAQLLGACRAFEKPLNIPDFLEAMRAELNPS